MDHERLADLFLLLGMTSLGPGCGGVVPLEDDGPSTSTSTDTDDGTTSSSSMPTSTTAGPSTTMTTASGTTAIGTDTGSETTTTGTTGIDFTDSGGRTDSSAGSTSTGDTTRTTSVVDDGTTSTTTGYDFTTTTGFAFTSGIFTGGFTSTGTGGPVVYDECAYWAYQYVYCYIPGYPGFEGFFRYYCNTQIIPAYYDYSMACGYAALQHFDCLSTLDCSEWPSLGMGTDCDGTLSTMEMMCGL